MEVRPGANPNDVKNYDTDRLRHDFLIQDVFVPGEIKTIYSQIDRIIVGSATPTDKALKLTAGDELRAAYFLERREMGVINIGMSIMGVDANYQKVVKGLVLLAAVIFDVVTSRKSGK